MGEWAIKDEATGEWWTGAHWRKEGPDGCVWEKYHCAAAMLGDRWPLREWRETARIVPAPPREMTDEEAEAWLRDRNRTLVIAHDSKGFFVQGVRDAHLGSGEVWFGPVKLRIHDAIRAARKKLESGR